MKREKGKPAKPAAGPAMARAQAAFAASGKTLEELGLAMGYAPDVARKSAWQFLNKTADPRLSMLRQGDGGEAGRSTRGLGAGVYGQGLGFVGKTDFVGKATL